MKSVLISIRPQWCEKIVNGEKTIEVRKTAPKEVPFKCYIYMTQGTYKNLGLYSESIYQNRMKVIGEFICDKVFLLHPYTYDVGSADLGLRKFIQTFEGSSKDNEILSATCLSQNEMFDYIGENNYGYGWHISDLKIYGKPKELSEFGRKCDYASEIHCRDCLILGDWDSCCSVMCKPITRPPQSYMEAKEVL